MELVQHIKNIIDGRAIIILGSGVSCGVEGHCGDFPSGRQLASSLYQECGLADGDDLQEAAESYIEKFDSVKLINKIKYELSVKNFKDYHAILYSQPWIRLYTTNYDNVAVLAARKKGKELTPVTLGNNFNSFRDKPGLCVHINGHIDNLNEKTLNDEFKLTSRSYLSTNNITKSQWGAILYDDLDVSKSIVIAGLSLEYDLDIARILFSESMYYDKCLIVDKEGSNVVNERKLKRCGKLFFGEGVERFAEEIDAVNRTYAPKETSPENFEYGCFSYKPKKRYPLTTPSDRAVFDLYIHGVFDDSLTFQKNGEYKYVVYRPELPRIIDAIKENKRLIFIHSDFGNGKSTMIELLKHSLSKEDIHVFELISNHYTTIKKEIYNIYKLKGRKIVIIENFFDHKTVLQTFMNHENGDITFILTARTGVFFNHSISIRDDFNIKTNETYISDVNSLGYEEIVACAAILSEHGLLNEFAGKSEKELIKILRDKKHGTGSFQVISLEIIKSYFIKTRLDTILSSIKAKSPVSYKAIMLIFVSKIMGLDLSTVDIHQLLEQPILKDIIFLSDPEITELLILHDGQKNVYKCKSAVLARHILVEMNSLAYFRELIVKIAEHSMNYSKTEKYGNILRAVISYSLIRGITENQSARDEFLRKYYEGLSELGYYKKNDFFWLQYAMCCIDLKEFDRALKYLCHARGLASNREGFIAFQIDNQEARLYLNRIIEGQSSDVASDFSNAHALLMKPVISHRDNESIVIRTFGLYTKTSFVSKMKMTTALSELHAECCRDAYNRITNYSKKPDALFAGQFDYLKQSLLKFYKNWACSH